MKVLNNIKQIRYERGISLRQLAKSSGVGFTTISKIENGYVIPTQLTMISIARGLKMDVTEVFDLDWRK